MVLRPLSFKYFVSRCSFTSFEECYIQGCGIMCRNFRVTFYDSLLHIQPIYFHLSPKETSINPSNIGQIWKPMTVLESARPEDSKTVPESWIWAIFSWDIEGRTQVIFNKNFPAIESVPELQFWSVFENKTF